MEALWNSQRMLIDTGASFSIMSKKITPFFNWTPSNVKLLEGFEGSEKMVGFSDLKVTRVGMKMGRFNFSLLNLGHIGIIGMELLDNWGIVIDLPIQVLRCASEAEGCHAIPARHWCSAIKAAEKFSFSSWSHDIKELALGISQVWPKDKLEHSQVNPVIWINGSDPKPQQNDNIKSQ